MSEAVRSRTERQRIAFRYYKVDQYGNPVAGEYDLSGLVQSASLTLNADVDVKLQLDLAMEATALLDPLVDWVKVLAIETAPPTHSYPKVARFVAADRRHLMHVDDPILSVGDIYWDMVAWVKTPDPAAFNQAIVFKGVSVMFPTNYEYLLHIWGNWFEFVARDLANAGAFDVQATTFGFVPANTWCMVHVYHNPGTNLIGISVNAGPHDTDTIVGIRDSTGDFQVGRLAGGGTGYYMDDSIGPLAIWKPTGTNLTAAQLTWLYNGGRGRDFTSLGAGELAGLVAWWQMDEASGTRASPYLSLTESGGTVGSEDSPWRITTPGLETEWPLGIYRLSTPRETLSAMSQDWALHGYGREIQLVQDKFTEAYTVTAGSNPAEAAAAICVGAGIPASMLNLPTTEHLLPVAMTWEQGIAKLRAVNELLASYGAYSPWADANGYLTSRVPVDLESETPARTYITGEAGIVIAPAERQQDDTGVANRVVVRVRNADSIYSIVATLADPSHRLHPDNLGYTRTNTFELQTVVDVGVAMDYAMRRLEEGLSFFTRSTIRTFLDFGRVGNAFEVYELDLRDKNDVVLVDGNWRVKGWTMGLGTDGEMVHELRRVEPIGGAIDLSQIFVHMDVQIFEPLKMEDEVAVA